MTQEAQPDLFGRTVGAVGDEHQRHFTPPRLSDVIVERLARRLGWAPDVVIEPSCGAGAFLRSAKKEFPDVYTIGVDIDPEAEGLAMCDWPIVGDWPTFGPLLKLALPRRRKVLVIGNPPFGAADDEQLAGTLAHIKAAIELGDATCLILPWAMLGGVPSYASIMHGEGAPVEAWPFFPRPWGLHIREAAAFLWGPGVGTSVEWLPRWKR
jgi:hypothetical protein